MINDLISIIVPIYNKEKYLNQCIESMHIQTYSKIEIILVDDGSEDKSPQICDFWAKSDKRIKVIHQENQGVGSARNNGIAVARGEFIMFVDADDVLDISCVEKMKLAMNSNVDMVVGSLKIMIEKEITPEVIALSKPGTYSVSEYMQQLAKHDVHYYYNGPVAKLIRNLLIDKNLEYEINDTLGEDFVFTMKLLRHIEKVRVIDDSVYIYRIDAINSLSKSHHVTEYFYTRYMKMYDEFCKTLCITGCEIICEHDRKRFENKIVKLVARNIIFDAQYVGYVAKRKRLKELRKEYISKGFLDLQKKYQYSGILYGILFEI